jgi:DNA-binding SARP family transcriptional activator
MPMLLVHLFGKLSVTVGEQPLCSFGSTKVQELFSYLLLHRHRPHSREALAALFWGDVPTAHSKKYLRQALWQLQAALNSTTASSLLRTDADLLSVNPDCDIWLDVQVLEQTFTRAEGRQGHSLNGESAKALSEAVCLYKGDLLEGWYQDWCLGERERLQNMFLALLDKLMSYCEAHCDFEMAITYGKRILQFDRAREHTHRQLMRLQYLAGHRTSALRQYRRCLAELDRELGVTPSRQTQALYEQIRADHLDTPSAPGTSLEAAVARLPGFVDHLEQLRVTLADLQAKVHQDIQTIEMALRSR